MKNSILMISSIRIYGAMAVLFIFILSFSSCFSLSNQNPCECATNAKAVNTNNYNTEMGQKCDDYEAGLSESDRAEWQRQLAACSMRYN